MLIVLLIISILITISGFVILINSFDLEELGGLISIFGLIASIVVIIWITVDVSQIVGLKTVDQRITMYEEENRKIEQDVATIVKDYMNYEQNTYKMATEEIDSSSLLVLTELYPELKANELVKKQIEIYTENNNKIKELKEEKINNQTCKWWLYFGKIEEATNE